MSLENDFNDVLHDIFEGRKDVAVFVVGGKYYYVVDDKENYCIDVEIEYKAYLAAGEIDENFYDEAVANFRGGIPVLDINTFSRYLDTASVAKFSVEKMRDFFCFGHSPEQLFNIYRHIEAILSNEAEGRLNELDQLRMRLPKFFIDLDNKVLRHTDWDRAHEDYAPLDWDAKASSDFDELISTENQYWVVNGMNFWILHA
ncbi:hypothetical protein [Pseudomonas sp. MPB26]|uniref:hypothetical protein n=1 Tax=Pseudomonas sp. MPB26 TaxID=3388491 RepID=UPI0039850FE7